MSCDINNQILYAKSQFTGHCGKGYPFLYSAIKYFVEKGSIVLQSWVEYILWGCPCTTKAIHTFYNKFMKLPFKIFLINLCNTVSTSSGGCVPCLSGHSQATLYLVTRQQVDCSSIVTCMDSLVYSEIHIL